MSIWAPAGAGSHATAITSIHARRCHLFIAISLSCPFGLPVSMLRLGDVPMTVVLHPCKLCSRLAAEAIAHPADRLDPRLRRPRRNELRAQPRHVHVDGARLHESILAPEQVQ